jgi:hypothetical protein
MAKKGLFEAVRRTAGMLALVLVVGMAVVGCSDGSTGGGGGGGGGSGGKPALLSNEATADQAAARLDEIIAYSETPDNVKTAAQGLKGNWSFYSSDWVSKGAAAIVLINGYIANIP